MNADLLTTYREVSRCQNSYIVGERAKGALRTAKDVLLAESLELEVKWDHDEFFSIGDQGDYISDEAFEKGLRSGRYEVLSAHVDDGNGTVLASLGGIVVDYREPSWREYLQGFEHELLSEAVTELKRGN